MRKRRFFGEVYIPSVLAVAPSSISSRSKGDPGLARDIAHEIGSKPVYLTVRNCTSRRKR
jgi:hypothetical protein